jgi:Predicted membrane protein/domain
MSELIITTPEHVPLALEPAGAGSRFLAILLDSLITTTIASTIALVVRLLTTAGVAYAVLVTISFGLPIAWHVWFETRGHGRTPGKRALSLRVVDARGLPVSLYQSLARNIVRAIDFAPAFYGVAAAVSLFDPARRRLGDIVANTLVIREVQPLAYRGQLATDRRHNSLRTPRVLRLIRHRVPLEEREFLLRLCLRAGKLTPTARYDLMEDVARFYRSKLAIEEEQISGENLVRDLTAVLISGDQSSGARRDPLR